MRAILENPADSAAAERLWAANPSWNGMLRTTCVTTEISGGHAPNALPQRASANVNCRTPPRGVAIESVREDLERVLADDGIKVSRVGEPGVMAPAPPLTPRIMEPVRRVAATIWPGVPVIPALSTGSTNACACSRSWRAGASSTKS